MKLVTLNIWGGTLRKDLINFIRLSKDKIDVFCLQEVFHVPKQRILRRGMCANIFGQIENVLTEHRAYFAPQLKGFDLEGKVNFDLEWGLAMFVRKNIVVEEINDFYIYRRGFELLKNDIKTMPRNLQYIRVNVNGDYYLIAHFHGVWYPKDKSDTDERLEQSLKIHKFLSARSEKIILCGDFNLRPQTRSLKILEDGLRNLIKEYKVKTTRSELYTGREKFADYVLVTPEVNVLSFKVLEELVSDHLPLVLEII